MKKGRLILVFLICVFSLISCALFEQETELPLTSFDEAYSYAIKNINSTGLTKSVNLPTTYKNAAITYSSSNEEYFSNTGIVTRPEEESVNVNLKIIVTIEENSKEYKLTLVVKGLKAVISLAEAYKTTGSELFYIGGNLTGKLSNMLFIKDNTGYMQVLVDSQKFPIDTYEVGDYLKIHGRTRVKNYSTDFNYVDNIEVKEELYHVYENENLDSFAGFDQYCQGRMVNFHSIKATSKMRRISILSSEYCVTFEDYYGNSMNLIINPHEYNNAINVFGNTNRGDYIALYDVGIAYDSYGPFLYFTDTTSIITKGFFVSSEELKVKYDTSLEEVLKEIEVFYYENGNKVILSSTDYTVYDNGYDPKISGEYIVKIKYQEFEREITITVAAEIGTPEKDLYATNLNDICSSKNIRTGLPSSGDVEILVVPITFTNYTMGSTTNSYYPSNYKEKLEIAFNGTSEQTGWESLSSYYNKISYGKVNLHATILDAYNTGVKYSTYSSAYSDEMPEQTWLKNALKSLGNSYDFSKFDNNNDGYIDCVNIIYLAPIDQGNGDLFWAYTTTYDSSYDRFGSTNLRLDYYTFSSYQFFTQKMEDDSRVTMNCETIIHETGHAFGINDYYDYGDGHTTPAAGSGSGIMMDYNVGDFDAYSKSILGWVNPYIGEEDCSITLRSFEATGDCLIIPKSWNSSYFDEYYIIDYYTPTGVNEKQKGYSGLCSASGIRIFYVNATLNTFSEIEDPWSITKYNNSMSTCVQLEFISARGVRIKSGDETSNSDLFTANKTFSPTKWYNGSSCGFTLTIDSINGLGATLTLTYN